jgi:PadR family transcriptional regulator PadR
MRMTIPTRLVLIALLAALKSGEKVYGLEICRRTGLKSGTVHPILKRLGEENWVEDEWETQLKKKILKKKPTTKKPKSGLDRPLRHYYKLTEAGRDIAQSMPQLMLVEDTESDQSSSTMYQVSVKRPLVLDSS